MVTYVDMVKSVEESPKEKNKCVAQAAQRDWKSQFATLGTFHGLILLVFATGKPLKVCEHYLFTIKTVVWMVSVLWAHIPHI